MTRLPAVLATLTSAVFLSACNYEGDIEYAGGSENLIVVTKCELAVADNGPYRMHHKKQELEEGGLR